jgi:hypothetical protein
MRKHVAILTAVVVVSGGVLAIANAGGDRPLDPAYNVALPCEAVATPGLAPRSAKNIVHVANVCGFVGTDIEFQSRVDVRGEVRDYAFVGTMGAGTRIFDVTDPTRPTIAGGYLDPGWQNDVSVRGDLLVIAFDWLGAGATVSTCLKQKGSGTDGITRGGIDIVRLEYDPQTATFHTRLVDCYLSALSSGGAHTVTIHPSGEWISMNSSFNGIEVVDVRGSEARLARHIPRAVADAAHDVSFSRDGNTLYSAGVGSTRIVDVTDVFEREPTLIADVPNAPTAAQGADGQEIAISHQSDTSADGSIFVVTDEAGGGLSETGCNTGSSGNIGGAHFWSLADPASPQKLGTWLYPNPVLAPDALAPALAAIGRTERACTIHVFRNGGNGSAGPGAIQAGYDGVSSLGERELVTAHYGAGVWHVDFSGPSSDADGIREDSRSTWANTLGWNVMPGADTWSAKEYKGYVYAGDMARGFDVYGFAPCEGAACIHLPTSTPGRASGGGKVPGEAAELAILRGTSAGGKASFGFDVALLRGALVPVGDLTFRDHATGKSAKATAIDSFTVAGRKATFTGRATVDGVPGVRFVVDVEDLGEPGTADTFRIVLGDGYGAGGVLLNGNVKVEGGR